MSKPRGLTQFVTESEQQGPSSWWPFRGRKGETEEVMTNVRDVPDLDVPPELQVNQPPSRGASPPSPTPQPAVPPPSGSELSTPADAGRGSPVWERPRKRRLSPGRKPREGREYWLDDKEMADCYKCHRPFDFFRRRHHCRVCGLIFCHECSSHWISGALIGSSASEVRACDQCKAAQEKPATMPRTENGLVSSMAQGFAASAALRLNPVERTPSRDSRRLTASGETEIQRPTSAGGATPSPSVDPSRASPPPRPSPSNMKGSAKRRLEARPVPAALSGYEPAKIDREEVSIQGIGLFPSGGDEELDTGVMASMCNLTGVTSTMGMRKPTGSRWREKVEKLAQSQRQTRSDAAAPATPLQYTNPLWDEFVFTAGQLETTPDLLFPAAETPEEGVGGLSSDPSAESARRSLESAAHAHLYNVVSRLLHTCCTPSEKKLPQPSPSEFGQTLNPSPPERRRLPNVFGSQESVHEHNSTAGERRRRIATTGSSQDSALEAVAAGGGHRRTESSVAEGSVPMTRRTDSNLSIRKRTRRLMAPGSLSDDHILDALQRAVRRGVRESHSPRSDARRGAVSDFGAPPPSLSDTTRRDQLKTLPEERADLSDPAGWASEIAAQVARLVVERVSDAADLLRVCDTLTNVVRNRNTDRPSHILAEFNRDPAVLALPRDSAESLARVLKQFESEFVEACALRYCSTRKVGTGDQAVVVENAFLASEVADWVAAHFSARDEVAEVGMEILRRHDVFELVSPPDQPFRNQVFRLLMKPPAEKEEKREASPWVVPYGENRFRWMVDALRSGYEKFDVHEYAGVVCKLAWKAVKTLRVFHHGDRGDERTLDIRDRVRVLAVEGGEPSASEYVCGSVVSRSFCHREMRTELMKPRILLVGGQIDFEQTDLHTDFRSLCPPDGSHGHHSAAGAGDSRSGHDSRSHHNTSDPSLAPGGHRDEQHGNVQGGGLLERLEDRVLATRPHVVLVERNCNLRIQWNLGKQGVCVATAVGRKHLERVRRTTAGSVVEDIQRMLFAQLQAAGRSEPCRRVKPPDYQSDGSESGGLPPPVLGTCELLQVRKRGDKALMYFCGGDWDRGAAIVLRGALRPFQAKIRSVVKFALFVAHNLHHEIHYLYDSHASLVRRSLYKDLRLRTTVADPPQELTEEERNALLSSTEMLSSSLCVDFGDSPELEERHAARQKVEETRPKMRRRFSAQSDVASCDDKMDHPSQPRRCSAASEGSQPISPSAQGGSVTNSFQQDEHGNLPADIPRSPELPPSYVPRPLQSCSDSQAAADASRPLTEIEEFERNLAAFNALHDQSTAGALSEAPRSPTIRRRSTGIAIGATLAAGNLEKKRSYGVHGGSAWREEQRRLDNYWKTFYDPMAHSSLSAVHTVLRPLEGDRRPLEGDVLRSSRDLWLREQSAEGLTARGMSSQTERTLRSPVASPGSPSFPPGPYTSGHERVNLSSRMDTDSSFMKGDGDGVELDGLFMEQKPMVALQYYRLTSTATSDFPLSHYLYYLSWLHTQAPPAVRHYSHHAGRVTVTTAEESDEVDFTTPVTWIRCKKCRFNSPHVRCSIPTLHYSLGKLLESSFYNHEAKSRLCGHSLHEDCVRYFGLGVEVDGRRVNVKVKFEYEKVRVYSVKTPVLRSEYDVGVFNKFVDAEYNELDAAGAEAFSNAKKTLDGIGQTIDEEVDASAVPAAKDWLRELNRRLNALWEDYSTALHYYAPECRDDLQGGDAVMEFSRQRIRLYQALLEWNKDIADSFFSLFNAAEERPVDRPTGVKRFLNRTRRSHHHQQGSMDWGELGETPRAEVTMTLSRPPGGSAEMSQQLDKLPEKVCEKFKDPQEQPRCTTDPFGVQKAPTPRGGSSRQEESPPPGGAAGIPPSLRTPSTVLTGRCETLPQSGLVEHLQSTAKKREVSIASATSQPTENSPSNSNRANLPSPQGPVTQPQSPAVNQEENGQPELVAASGAASEPSPNMSGDLGGFERTASNCVGARLKGPGGFRVPVGTPPLSEDEDPSTTRIVGGRRSSQASTPGTASASGGGPASRPGTPSRQVGPARSPRWNSPPDPKRDDPFRQSAVSVFTPPMSPRQGQGIFAGAGTLRTRSVIGVGGAKAPQRAGPRIPVPDSLCGINTLMNLQPGVDGKSVIVRVDEPTSIIAYTLCSEQHKRGCEATPPSSPRKTAKWNLTARGSSQTPPPLAASSAQIVSGAESRFAQNDPRFAKPGSTMPAAHPGWARADVEGEESMHFDSTELPPTTQDPTMVSPMRNVQGGVNMDSASTQNSGEASATVRVAPSRPVSAEHTPDALFKGDDNPRPSPMSAQAKAWSKRSDAATPGAVPVGGTGSAPRRHSDRALLDLLLNETKMRRVVVDEKELDESRKERLLFSCTVMCARHFAALRQIYCQGDETMMLASLSRCEPFGATGGKSGSDFYRTKDGRFLLKAVKSEEMNNFTDQMAHRYFNYIAKSICPSRQGSIFPSYLPTLIVKILGVFRITALRRDAQGGSQTISKDWILMENLFYNRKVDRMFDLKGSRRSRRQKDPSAVQMDQNLVDRMKKGDWFFVATRGHDAIQKGVFNDTVILKKCGVMDYSLLVGVSEEKQELYVGIIDYMREYDLAKKAENIVKNTGILGRGQPTIVSPRLYSDRFRKAMAGYFMMMPYKSTPWVHQARELPEDEPPRTPAAGGGVRRGGVGGGPRGTGVNP
eukprot:Hpha_TRINITY_DN15770_c5_g14::TRINITY_DN15770_c5_g14_i1::g.41340::m.41340/K00921/PIKFYVE, FAB1; 1-phosphatidylinositol-3-phosphate 5-kinase